MERIDMPDHLAQNLIMSIHQNEGNLPKRCRKKEFEDLTDEEVLQVESHCAVPEATDV